LKIIYGQLTPGPTRKAAVDGEIQAPTTSNMINTETNIDATKDGFGSIVDYSDDIDRLWNVIYTLIAFVILFAFLSGICGLGWYKKVNEDKDKRHLENGINISVATSVNEPGVTPGMGTAEMVSMGESKRIKSLSDDALFDMDDEDNDVTPAMPLSYKSQSSIDGMFTTPVVGAQNTPFGPIDNDSAPLMLSTPGGTAKGHEFQGGIIQEDESYSSSEIDDMNDAELYDKFNRKKTNKGRGSVHL